MRKRLNRAFWVSAVIILLAGAGCGGAAERRNLSAQPPPAATPERPETITVAAAGDLFVPPRLTAQAAEDAAAAGRDGHDFTAILASVAPVIAAADLAICHVEQPLAEPEGPFPDYPYFAAPPQLADAIASAGFDTCSTSSNHALDGGMAGITRTLAGLDRVGV